MSTLMRWPPLKEVHTLRQQVDRLFDDLLHNDRISNLLAKDEFFPAIEIQETETELILKVQVPGMKAEDLDIQLSPERLEITGEQREESTSDTATTFHSELHYGMFRRMVALPIVVNHQAATAKLENGIVRLVMPKLQPDQCPVVKVNLTQQDPEVAPAQAAAKIPIKDNGNPPKNSANRRVPDKAPAMANH
jgi:HSP20 family protein